MAIDFTSSCKAEKELNASVERDLKSGGSDAASSFVSYRSRKLQRARVFMFPCSLWALVGEVSNEQQHQKQAASTSQHTAYRGAPWTYWSRHCWVYDTLPYHSTRQGTGSEAGSTNGTPMVAYTIFGIKSKNTWDNT